MGIEGNVLPADSQFRGPALEYEAKRARQPFDPTQSSLVRDSEASRLEGYLALPPEVHPVRHACPFLRARTFAALEAVRLKKPYTPGVHRLGRSDYIDRHYTRVAAGSRSSLVAKLNSDEAEMSPATLAGRDARVRARLRRSFANELLEARRFGERSIFSDVRCFRFPCPLQCPTQRNAGI